ncbi:MAG: response regulator transcription factor [Saprospiraceae bacterium]|nr:response regulator transcription factor [Saprospiraceae bacterium]
MARILYIEDDQTLSYVTKDNLEKHGYEVVHFRSGTEALAIIEKCEFELALLDIMLPRMSGFEIASMIRAHSVEVPILFLSAKSMKEDRLHGFMMGADDYIVKPFSIEELIFKINVFLKRSKISTSGKHLVFHFGQSRYDHQNLILLCGNEEKTLTQREGELLRLLLLEQNKLCERAHILRTIWGENDYFMGRSLDVFISRLRKYLSSDPNVNIENIHGVGFKLLVN